MLKTTDNQTLLAGANAVGLLSLMAYTLRTFNEVNSNIDELRSELDAFRKNYSDNNKRSNLAFNHLNTKLEENTRKLNTKMMQYSSASRERHEPRRVVVQEPEEEPIEEISTSSFTNNVNDEISGALSELLSG